MIHSCFVRVLSVVLFVVALLVVVELFCRPLRGLCGFQATAFHGLKPEATELPPFGLKKQTRSKLLLCTLNTYECLRSSRGLRRT